MTTNRESLPKPRSWYRTDRANRIAADLTEGEDGGWTYLVILDTEKPVEYAAVALFDEDGEFVTYWNEY